MATFDPLSTNFFTAEFEAALADFYAKESDARSNEFSDSSQSLLNVVNVAISPPIPTADNLQPTIEYAQSIVNASVAESGVKESNIVVTLLETLDDAAGLAEYVALQRQPAVWFGNIQVIMNGLTDAQRTTIGNLDIGSQVSVTKTFPNSTPSSVTQLMALEGISHDITPDRHIVTLYTNPARIYTYFIVGGYTTTTTRTNLVINPSFETNTTSWTNSANCAITRITTDSLYGVASLQVTLTNPTDGNGPIIVSGSRFPITAGVAYIASGYAKVPVGQPNVSLDIDLLWYNGISGPLVGSVDGVNFTLSSADGWRRFTVTGTAPATATHARIRLGSTGIFSGTFVYLVDGFLLETGSTLLPYFDGTYADTYTGYTLTEQAWNGTADASTSTATWGLTSSFVGSELNDDTKGLG